MNRMSPDRTSTSFDEPIREFPEVVVKARWREHDQTRRGVVTSVPEGVGVTPANQDVRAGAGLRVHLSNLDLTGSDRAG